MSVPNNNKVKMHSSNITNSTPNGSWFHILKNSFRSCKSGLKSKMATDGNNSSKNLTNDDFFSDGAERYFTDEFLDSFNTKPIKRGLNDEGIHSKNSINRGNFCLPPKLSENHAVNVVTPKKKLEPKEIEGIFSLVVEDYIMDICEEMLRNKMKNVLEKLQQLKKNQLTRPGFKLNNNFGGNITKMESFMIPTKTSIVLRKEYNERKDSFSKDMKRAIEKLEKASNAKERMNVKMNPKSSKRGLSLSKIFEKQCLFSRTNRGMRVQSEGNSNYHSNSTLSSNNVEKIDEYTESRKKRFSMKSFIQKFDDRMKNNDSLTTTIDDVTSSKLALIAKNNLPDNEKMVKDVKKSKVCTENSGYKKVKHKALTISETFHISIEPTDKVSKSLEAYSDDKSNDTAISSLNNISKKTYKNDIRGKNRKIRRSVTFLDPKISSFIGSPLRRDAAFSSNLDMRTSNNLSSFYCATGENINDCPSSNTLNSCQGSDTKNADIPSPVLSTIINEVDTSTMKDLDRLSQSNSPVLVTLHSLSGNNSQKSSEDPFDHLLDNVASRLKETFIGETGNKKSLNELKETCKTFKSTQNCGQNYSIIEIVNRMRSKSDGERLLSTRFSEEEFDKSQVNEREVSHFFYESSVDDSQLIVATDTFKSQTLSSKFDDPSESMISCDDNTMEVCSLKRLTKPSLISQIRTANFSSISMTKEDRLSSDVTIKETPQHSLSFTSNVNDRGMKELQDRNVCLKDIKEIQNQIRVANPKKVIENAFSNNILKHTLSSKLKCRIKVSKPSQLERQPMKFSTHPSKD